MGTTSKSPMDATAPPYGSSGMVRGAAHQRDAEPEPLLGVEDELVDVAALLVCVALAAVVLEADAQPALRQPRARFVDVGDLPDERPDLPQAVLGELGPEGAPAADRRDELDVAVEVGCRQDRVALDRVGAGEMGAEQVVELLRGRLDLVFRNDELDAVE